MKNKKSTKLKLSLCVQRKSMNLPYHLHELKCHTTKVKGCTDCAEKKLQCKKAGKLAAANKSRDKEGGLPSHSRLGTYCPTAESKLQRNNKLCSQQHWWRMLMMQRNTAVPAYSPTLSLSLCVSDLSLWQTRWSFYEKPLKPSSCTSTLTHWFLHKQRGRGGNQWCPATTNVAWPVLS